MPAPRKLDAPRDVRVVVVDHQELFRRGLALVLAQADAVAVVGEAADGAEAVEIALRTAPDVVVVEIRTPGADGAAAADEVLEACRDLIAQVPGARVLVLSSSDDEADLYRAMAHGATGYVLKDASVPELVQAVRAVAAGQTLISPTMTATMVSGLRRDDGDAARGTPGRLTDRELEVLRLLARGLANREVATRLGISENTVKNHVRHLLDKLGLHSRVEATLYAVRERLVEV